MPEEQVNATGQEVRFTLQGDTSFTYTVTASSVEGSYGFSGTLRNYDRNDHAVGGASTVAVSSGDPLIARYDANNNGMIDKSEVIVAINDYLFGEGEPITKAEVIKLINLYLFGPSAAQPPGAPTGLTATANGQTRIDLSWRAPSDDGGAAITGYRIEVSPDGSNWTNLVADAGSTSTSYTHTGLTAGSTRHYRVSAINSAGTGPVSNTATGATATAGAPGAPTGLTTTANGQTRIDLSWSAPSSNGVAAITGYKIEVSENGSSWSDLETNTGSTSTSYTHTGLTAGSTRHYRVLAINSAGTGPASNVVTATAGTAPAPDLVVDAPTVNNSSPDAGASFTLSATVRNQGDGGSSSTTLRYYRSTDGTITRSDTSVGTDSVFRIDASGTSDESISLTAPDSADAYYYGACVDAVSGESDATNNCSTGVEVNVTAATSSSARDRDGDGLIEVDNLAQLDAVRWDLDGNGISDNADYAAAFSDADIGTMCSVTSCAGYELTANLDFDTNGNGEADEGDVYWNGGGGWIPIGESNDPFVAIFEGGGRRISNLYIRRSPNVGLFGVLGSGSTVSGIGLVDTNVVASGYGAAGALAGIGHGVIEDSFADGLVAGCVDHIGGLVGLNGGNIANSRSAGNVASARRSTSSAPGLIGDFINDLIDFPLFGSGSRTCYASGGGLVGENSGTIANSHSTSVVSGFTDKFGGLVGANSGAITDSYATGNVSGKGCPGECFAKVGGLVGQNEVEGKITTSYATGGVSGQGDNFGGLAGVNSGIIIASYATGSVSGSGFADVGGLVGDNKFEGKITTSYATGGVSGQADNFGGLAGVNSGVIVASYATGSVSGNGFADVGGLVGDNRYTGVVTAAYAEGSVSGRADRYGGLLGSNQGVVTVCFSTGGVPQRGGGLIGSNGNYGAVASCYWDTETSGQSDSAGGEGKTTAELRSPTGYTGAYADWNVDLDGDGSSDDPWRFGSTTEYPVLNLGTLDID